MAGGHRRYDLAKRLPERFRATQRAARPSPYARVLSHDHEDDLERQKQVLKPYCAAGSILAAHRILLRFGVMRWLFHLRT